MRTWISLALMLLTGQTAYAYPVSYGELTCEGDRALLRFGEGLNEEAPVFPELPKGIAPFRTSPVDGNRCELTSGRAVVAKMATIQARAYGLCGGANRSLASLWVGGRRILSRQRVVEPCFDLDLADIWVVEGDTLTLCRSAEAVDRLERWRPRGLVPSCRTVAFSDLPQGTLPATVEKPLGKVEITQGDPEFCSRFIESGTTPPTGSWALGAAGRMDSWNDPRRWKAGQPMKSGMVPPADYQSLVPPVGTKRPFAEQDSKGLRQFMSWRHDVDHDGAAEVMIRQVERSGAFEGDIVYLLSQNITPEMALDSLESLSPEEPLPNGITRYTGILEGVSDDYDHRFTYQDLFVVESEALVFAAPVFRNVRPTALIYRILPDGGPQTVCVFQRVEDRF